MANNNKKNQHRWAPASNAKSEPEPEAADKKLEFQGEVIEAQRGTFFQVRLDEIGTTVLCTLGGKVRINRIRILPGDRVAIEVSPYDLTRGRITWRR